MLCGWGVKAGMVRVWVAGKTVIPYLGTLVMRFLIVWHYTNRPLFTFTSVDDCGGTGVNGPGIISCSCRRLYH